jgi:hypothetical protein
MRGLCYHYRVELHNFAPNAISQAACLIAVCEGFPGIPANWHLWVHLFCAELHTLAMGEAQMHRAVRASGLKLTLRDTHKELYPPCRMTSNNADWEKGWFYLRNDSASLPPYTGKVLMAKTDAWHHGVSPPAWQWRLESLTTRPEHFTGRAVFGPKKSGFSGRENPAHDRPIGRVGPQFSGRARAWAGRPRIL